MTAYSQLPPQFAGLEGRVRFVQKINENEYHSSCPNCGIDESHNDSNPSDRFVMWLSSRHNGKPFGMCIRHCRYHWTPDKQDAVWTPEEKEEFRRKAREFTIAEDERIRDYAKNVIMKQAIYKKYFEQFRQSAIAKEFMAKRGFSDEWLIHFGYGFEGGYRVSGRESVYYSPAIIRPVMNVGGIVENLKVRTMYPHCSEDRFRNLYKTRAQHLHFPLWQEGLKKKALIIEGEMKADYAAMSGYVPQDITIVGTQGKGIGDRAYYQLESVDAVYICLDPDAFKPDKNGTVSAVSVAKRFGVSRSRFVIVNEKIDDAMEKGFNLANAINTATKPQNFKYWK